MKGVRLAILSTHPIQYHAHWFRALARTPGLEPVVFYCYYATPRDQARAGFGVEFDWDIPVLDGYNHRFLNNVAQQQSPDGFFAQDTPEIAQILPREHFDAVLINGWHYKAAWQAMWACWKARIPIMVRGDSQLATPRGSLKRLLKYPVYRTFLSKVNACLAVGTRSRGYYLHYGVQPERIFLVPHAIDSEYFGRLAQQAESHLEDLRRHWRLPHDAVVFLFSGKFIEKKRPMDFLQAIEAASRMDPRIAGVMAGDGPLRPACQEYAEAHKIGVKFLGFLNQSQIVNAYVGADALVLPSDARETWGLVVNEAMACGRPAFVSDAVGCGPDLVQETRTGGVYPLGDVSALARLLVEAAASSGRLREMGVCARTGLKNNYSVESAVRGVADAAAAVVEEARRQ